MKKLNYYLVILFSLLLLACRTDENEDSKIENQYKPINAFVNFEKQIKFQKSSEINYAYPFAEIISNFINRTPEFKENFEKEYGKIDLSLASQTFGENNKYNIFPIIKKGHVSSLLICEVNADRTYARFKVLDSRTPKLNIKEIIDSFEAKFSAKSNRINTTAREVAIEEIIITVYYDYYIYWSSGSSGSGTSGGGNMDGDGTIHGSGGSGGTTSANQNIIDNLDGYPCAQDLLKQLPNLNNDLAKLLNDLFKNSDKYNITFKPKSGLGETDGITSSGGSKEFGTFKVTIFLNDQVLKNATKEYILITMYHEVVHAYLDYEKFTLGNAEFEKQFPNIVVGNEYLPDGTIKNRYFFDDNHVQFGPYLSELKQILKSYNSGLSDETVSALAKFGITGLTDKEKEINKNERDTTKGTYTGTKCP